MVVGGGTPKDPYTALLVKYMVLVPKAVHAAMLYAAVALFATPPSTPPQPATLCAGFSGPHEEAQYNKCGSTNERSNWALRRGPN